MSSLPEVDGTCNFPAESTSVSINKDLESTCFEQKIIHTRPLKALSNFFSSTFSIFEAANTSSTCPKKKVKARNYGWATTVRKVVSINSMRRFQERFMWGSRCDFSSSSSDIWLLGKRYKASVGDSSNNDNSENGLVDFHEDFSSRIWLTYRKGFNAIGDSKFTSDVNWGCMIRSSQMLVAQALIFHYLGRSWKKPEHKPYDPKYIEILHHFSDTEESTFSIHNLLQAGKGHGLAAGSWVGPYAMCRSWEILARRKPEGNNCGSEASSLPMVVYIVSGDEDGERGGAPVVCIDVASRLCSEFCKGEDSWAPILLLVPLVLGLDKVNPRYIPLLWETFTFPQSLGILGGKPGASTYIIGVQDDKAFYLDPHEVQTAVDIPKNNLDADTSSYHCSTIRHLPLEQIDPSLAIGFYCRDRDDFSDFCARAYQLMDKSSGAPLFTIAESLQRREFRDDALSDSPGGADNSGMGDVFAIDKNLGDHDIHQHEDDWQLL